MKGKKIVKGVVELVTYGVALTDQLLESKGNNFPTALSFSKDKTGVAFLDISTEILCCRRELNTFQINS